MSHTSPRTPPHFLYPSHFTNTPPYHRRPSCLIARLSYLALLIIQRPDTPPPEQLLTSHVLHALRSTPSHYPRLSHLTQHTSLPRKSFINSFCTPHHLRSLCRTQHASPPPTSFISHPENLLNMYVPVTSPRHLSCVPYTLARTLAQLSPSYLTQHTLYEPTFITPHKTHLITLRFSQLTQHTSLPPSLTLHQARLLTI